MNKKHTIIFSTALIILLLDQLTKFIIRVNFQLNESIPVIKNIFHFTYITNTGSAFGLFKGLNILFILFSLVVIAVTLYFLGKIKENERMIQLSVGLLLGGTLGNLVDRLFHGAVTDFLDFRVWPVFNVADSAITISVTMLIILLWKK